MKLYVDDIRPVPDETWNLAKTALAAIRTIAFFGEDITEISLDHDISHQVTIGTGLERPYPCEETFASVAYFIGAYYKGKKSPHITLHTSNPIGAETMQYAIEKFGEYTGTIDVKFSKAANRLELEV